MPTPLLIVIMLIVASVASAYTTTRICKSESEWQEITYAGNSVEPKDFYICKECRYQANKAYHYCSNCGSKMINGMSRHYYSEKIKLSE